VSGPRIAVATIIVVATWAAAIALVVGDRDEAGGASAERAGHVRAPVVHPPDPGTAPVARTPLAVSAASGPTPVRIRFRDPPRAGLLFDVGSGEVLWQEHPRRRLPIASLTKMMTALLIAERHRLTERLRITAAALNYAGSGIGVLPRGKRVELKPLLYGLMLVSGNDAAIALAQHDARSQRRFVARMNRRAGGLGLGCTHFSSPSGIRDRGNYSCPLDLATLARLDLANPVIRRIVATRRARFRFPAKGGILDLFNINPFIASGKAGFTGVKTGLTDAAGRCYVITAHRGGRHLGVVLLHSPDPLRQVPRLLRAGARASGRP
jgi:serine-type D-Ala-D-Ala carboxypeptidase (penicillin-binding protein 5/6)